jgi:predicted PurR-regulated permease PerM
MSVQAVTRIALATVLVTLGTWIVHGFLPALAWAAVLAVALAPAYRRLCRVLPGRGPVAPLVAILLVALVFVVPLGYAAVETVREMGPVIRYLVEARHAGLPPPDWLAALPGIGSPLAEWWQDNLADPQAAGALLDRAYRWLPTESARHFGAEIVRRMSLFAVTLLALFFLFRDGAALGAQLRQLSRRLLGPDGERIAEHMIAAVHGTVNGLVLVGLAEGVLLGFAYRLAGLPHPVTMAAVTGVLAVIPFGAPLAFGGAAAYLLAAGAVMPAAGLLGFGIAVTFVADHFVRPALIGGAARLPFLWVLLGILGGLQTLGLLGLFLGPMVMAALISLWREWTASSPPDRQPCV